MDFTNMTYAQVVSEKAQIKAKLGLIDIWRRNVVEAMADEMPGLGARR